MIVIGYFDLKHLPQPYLKRPKTQKGALIGIFKPN